MNLVQPLNVEPEEASPVDAPDASEQAPEQAPEQPKTKVDLADWFRQAELVLQQRHRSWPRQPATKVGVLALNGWPRDAQRVMVLITVLRDSSARVQELERGMEAMRAAHDIVARVAGDFVLQHHVAAADQTSADLIDILQRAGVLPADYLQMVTPDELPPAATAEPVQAEFALYDGDVAITEDEPEAADPATTPTTGPSEPLDDPSLPVDMDALPDNVVPLYPARELPASDGVDPGPDGAP